MAKMVYIAKETDLCPRCSKPKFEHEDTHPNNTDFVICSNEKVKREEPSNT